MSEGFGNSLGEFSAENSSSEFPKRSFQSEGPFLESLPGLGLGFRFFRLGHF